MQRDANRDAFVVVGSSAVLLAAEVHIVGKSVPREGALQNQREKSQDRDKCPAKMQAGDFAPRDYVIMTHGGEKVARRGESPRALLYC